MLQLPDPARVHSLLSLVVIGELAIATGLLGESDTISSDCPAATLCPEESQLINEALFEKISSRDPLLEKEAIDAVNDFTRIKMREEGFYRKIMPPLQISNDELDRQVDTDKEPDAPAAISIPLATLPTNLYIRGNRYLVMIDHIVTPRFTKDVNKLRTWIMDIRQVPSDNVINDMLAEADGRHLSHGALRHHAPIRSAIALLLDHGSSSSHGSPTGPKEVCDASTS